MTLPASGPISMNQVRSEIGRFGGGSISMGETHTRECAKQMAGSVSMSAMYNKNCLPQSIFGENSVYYFYSFGGPVNTYWSENAGIGVGIVDGGTTIVFGQPFADFIDVGSTRYYKRGYQTTDIYGNQLYAFVKVTG